MVVTINTGVLWLIFGAGFFVGGIVIGIIAEKIGG